MKHTNDPRHNAYFLTDYHFLPIIHSGRYYQSFYGPLTRKPPMCLQYAIWALSASGNAKYNQYAEVFYKRARQYMEADEMRVGFFSFCLFLICLDVPLSNSWAERWRAFCYSSSRTSMGHHRQLRSKIHVIHKSDHERFSLCPACPDAWIGQTR